MARLLKTGWSCWCEVFMLFLQKLTADPSSNENHKLSYASVLLTWSDIRMKRRLKLFKSHSIIKKHQRVENLDSRLGSPTSLWQTDRQTRVCYVCCKRPYVMQNMPEAAVKSGCHFSVSVTATRQERCYYRNVTHAFSSSSIPEHKNTLLTFLTSSPLSRRMRMSCVLSGSLGSLLWREHRKHSSEKVSSYCIKMMIISSSSKSTHDFF